MTAPATPLPPKPVSAEVVMAVPLPQASAWFADPTRLPLWTGFFSHVGPAGPDGRHSATSLAGPITTWTSKYEEPHEHQIGLTSLIQGRYETARFTLTAEPSDHTRVAFGITLLHPGNPAQVHAQQERLLAELHQARRLLELAA